LTIERCRQRLLFCIDYIYDIFRIYVYKSNPSIVVICILIQVMDQEEWIYDNQHQISCIIIYSQTCNKRSPMGQR
jgi:hypothetical protein